MPKIQSIRSGSIAEELELEPGDEIKTINGQPVKDIIDYQFAITDEAIELEVVKANGEEWLIDVEKGYDESLGIEWEHPTVDRIKLCHNKCVFCFVDQIPGNMRQTLNMRDDDYRLSFLHGNFVTLTNLKPSDLERIATLKMSPLNISVHTTNPELRNFMVGHKKAGEILNQIAYLAEHDIEMNTQIVMCPGLNDGEELDRTIRELAPFWPHVRTLSVVPVGLTKHRRALTELRTVTPEEASRVIDQVEKWQNKFLKEHGASFVHAADEFYVLADREVPAADHYDEFAQTENGVGLIRNFLDEMEEVKHQIPTSIETGRHVAVVTGVSAAKTIRRGLELIKHVQNLKVDLHVIQNDFYGSMVTVAGLTTGSDIVAQLKQSCGADTILIPDIMLKDDADIFLDDYSVGQVSSELGKPVTILPANATGLIKGALGLTKNLPPRKRYEATLSHAGTLGCAGIG